MTDEERAYREAMAGADQALQSIHDQVQQIADRLGNGAVMSYPDEHRDPELFEIHARLTARSDDIINRMQAIQRAFISRTPPEK